MGKQANCDLCDKHCPIGSFGCGRGEHAYGDASREAAEAIALGGLAGKLVQAGRIAGIKASHIKAAGKDPNAMFDVLGADDKATFDELLGKLQAGWDEMHAAH